MTCVRSDYMEQMHLSLRVKKGIRNSIILPTLSYASETWTWNTGQQTQIRAMEKSYVRGACEISRWDQESTENVYESYVKCAAMREVDYGVAELMKHGTLR